MTKAYIVRTNGTSKFTYHEIRKEFMRSVTEAVA